MGRQKCSDEGVAGMVGEGEVGIFRESRVRVDKMRGREDMLEGRVDDQMGGHSMEVR